LPHVRQFRRATRYRKTWVPCQCP